MKSVKLKVKNVFVSFGSKLLSFRYQVSEIYFALKSRLKTQTENNQEYSNANNETSTLLLDKSSDRKLSCCSLYTANYDGTTCIQQQFVQPTCCTCSSSAASVVDFVKAFFGCLINLLCYPFIPCAIAFLPASFQFAGYTNENSLYPCYGKTCCFCIKNDNGGCLRLFCSPACCLVFMFLFLAGGCFFLWSESQSSLLVIDLLLYFEALSQPASVFLFVLSFTIVSFPIMWGYVLFNLAAGYLYGFWMGLSVVIFSVTIGLSISHIICKKYFATCVMKLLRKRSNFDQIEAILQVIDGTSGLKVVALTRLTPIPFGFQNGLFAVSKVSLKYYLLASDVGLLPTQILNCYIASKFRSMDQIVDQKNPKGFLFFFLQVAIGVALMTFVVQRARKELASALQQNNKAILPVSTTSNGVAVNDSEAQLENIKCTQPSSSITSAINELEKSIIDL